MSQTAVRHIPSQSAPRRPRIRAPIAVMAAPMTQREARSDAHDSEAPRMVVPPLIEPTIK